jgi:hypothetical protein
MERDDVVPTTRSGTKDCQQSARDHAQETGHMTAHTELWTSDKGMLTYRSSWWCHSCRVGAAVIEQGWTA